MSTELRNVPDCQAEECKYCGGDCPNDEEHACDGYLGDIDGLYEASPSVEKTIKREIPNV